MLMKASCLSFHCRSADSNLLRLNAQLYDVFELCCSTLMVLRDAVEYVRYKYMCYSPQQPRKKEEEEEKKTKMFHYFQKLHTFVCVMFLLSLQPHDESRRRLNYDYGT